MRRPFGDLPCRLEIKEFRAVGAAPPDELELRPDRRQPPGTVLLCRPLQRGKARNRVVEIRNRLIQPPLEIGKIVLETPERRSRLERLLRRLEDVVGARIFDKAVTAEKVPFAVAHERTAVLRRNQLERPVTRSRIPGTFETDLLADMGGHTFKVLHQLFRLLEHIRIDPLHDVADPGAALVERHRECIVDMARAERHADHIFAPEIKGAADAAQIIFHCRISLYEDQFPSYPI